MTTRDKVIREAKTGKVLRTTPLATKLQVSRQTVSRILNSLVEQGLLNKSGATRGATYTLASGKKKRTNKSRKISLAKQIEGLSEQSVWLEIETRLPVKDLLNRNARSIVAYAFTEMLNNAIDHSESSTVAIDVSVSEKQCRFLVRDKGVGIFYNIQRKFNLADQFAALEHVLKGKQTTMPEAHSGEGLFFTSRIADVFEIRSHTLKVRFDNRIPDSFVSEERKLKGTEVSFEVKSQTKKKLDDLFKEFSNEDFEFDKNSVRIKISTFTGALSRSQARRILFGLEKYDRIIFDFKGVKQIGQAFADEVFRVFVLTHAPRITVDYANAERAVEFMIKRAKFSDSLRGNERS